MGTTPQVRKKTTISKEKKRTPKRKRRTKQKTSNRYEPARLKPQVQMMKERNQSLPFHSLVGETNLDPYVWITLKKDLRKGPKNDRLNPIHKGLKSISLSNEKKKYPKVDFVLYVPDFRDNKKDSGRSINEFIIGAEFFVKWGYSSNHTQWGPFRVTERDISFDEGTALLQVTGIMGARLFATSTAEVFSNAEGKLAIDQIASLVNISVNKKELLDEEYNYFLDDKGGPPLIAAGGNLGQAIYKDTVKNDVDFYFDPEVGEIKLSTPFKYELVKQGKATPVKMTYGYPTSNIAKLDVETKHPIKKGVSPNTVVRINQKPKGLSVVEGNTLRYAIEGLIPYVDTNNQTKELIIGTDRNRAWGKWVFSTKKVKDPRKRGGVIDENSIGSVAQAISNAEQVWKPEKGYKVSAVEASIGHHYDSMEVDSWAMLIERVVTLPKNLAYEDKKLNIFEYNQAVKNRSKPVVLLSTGLDENNEVSVRVYSDLNRAVESKPLPKKTAATKSDKLTSTTVESVPVGSIDTPEGEETTDEIVETLRIRSDLLNYKGDRRKLRPKFRKLLEEYEAKLLQFKNRSFENNSLRVASRSFGEVSAIALVRVDPTKANGNKSNEGKVSDTASGESDNPNSSFKPKAQSSGVGRPSRRITRTKLSIDLKAGDWTMRVGTIIEIVDLHKKINGFYYVFSEEHTIDSNGFHTSIQCKKASQRMVDKYSTSAKKRSNSKKPTNTTRVAAGAEVPAFQINKQALDALVDEESKTLSEKSSELRNRELTMAMISPTMVRFETGM
jgi:hypothetical protein